MGASIEAGTIQEGFVIDTFIKTSLWDFSSNSIELIFHQKLLLSVSQIHLGDGKGAVNLLRHEPVRSGPPDVLHRGHAAVTARRYRWGIFKLCLKRIRSV